MTHKFVGGPGAGKTKTLLDLVVQYQKAAYLSFTRSAVGEAKERAEKLNINTEYFKTLHALAYKLLGVKRSMMLDFKQMATFKQHMGDLGHEISFYFDEDTYQERRSIPLYLQQLSVNLMKPIEEIYKNGSWDVSLKDVKYVVKCYEDFKTYYSVFDFNDLLVKTLSLKNIQIDVEAVFLDEAQDLTVLQWEVFNHLFKDTENKYIVGDDCQCLYHWAGVDIDRFINLKYDKLTILDKSYRVPENILNVSEGIFKKIENKIDRKIKPCDKGGKVRYINNIEYSDFNTKESYFILIRNWYLHKNITESLKLKGIPFLLDKKSSINERDFKAIVNWERWRKGRESQNISLLKDYVQNLNQNVPWFEAFRFMDLEKAVYYREILRNGFSLNPEKIGIEIMTIHKSKGREADHIILFQDVSNRTFEHIKNDTEHKVFYVGVTRAKKSLTFVRPDTLKYYEVV